MTRAHALTLAALALVGCGSASADPPPTRCNPSTDRVGTYLLHFVTDSGNCGTPPDTLVVLGQTGSSTCSITSNTWSDGNCRNDYVEDCSGSALDGYWVQETQDGSRLSGKESVVGPACDGLDDVTLTRQ